MNPSSPLTAEEFAESKYDFPEGGRWTELERGELVTLSPPDDVHGNVVLNLTKALAEHAQTARDGYACFELGLVIARDPDTIRCPAVSYFQEGELFSEMDKLITETVPALVVEIASSNDRRQNMADRVTAYREWGVRQVWLIDTHLREVHLCGQGQSRVQLRSHEKLLGRPILSDFQCRVGDLFEAPEWY